MIDDHALLRNYAATGAEEAFATFVQRHIGMVHAAALRRTGGDCQSALDVSQQVFVAAAQQASSLAQHACVTGWLYVFARNAAYNMMRDERRRKMREHEIAEHIELPAEPEAGIDWKRVRLVLDDAMDELNERDREAVLLRFFANRRFAEIGANLQLSENAARMRVERALEKLRNSLVKRGVPSTSGALALALTSHASAAVSAEVAAGVTSAALAGGPSIGIAGIGGIMGSSKLITATMGAAVLLAGGMAVFEVITDHKVRAELVVHRQENATLLAQVANEEGNARAAERRLVTLQGLLAEGQASRAASSPQPNPMEAGNAFLAAHPQIKQLLDDGAKARSAGNYYPLYWELGLTQAQINEFEEIIISGISSTFRNFPGVGTMQLIAGSAMSEGEKQERLRSLLGEDGYARFRDFGPYSSITKIASQLYSSDTPLTAEQGRQLRRVFTAAQPVASAVRDGAGVPDDYYLAITNESRRFLSPPQITALERSFLWQKYSHARAQVSMPVAPQQASSN